MFLVDASQSVPQRIAGPGARLRRPRRRRSGARTTWPASIVFGKAPRVEAPPAPTELNLLGIESTIDPEYTDLGAAIKLALATFPEDTARRIVLLSDGNENRGNALEQALAAKELGVADRRPADRVPLRPRGPGREGLDPPRRQEGGDGQHQRRDPRQRADQRHAADLPEGRQLPRPRPRQREARADRAPARGQRLHAQAADHRAELLYVHRRIHPRPGQRRPPDDQQRGRGVHPRPRARRRCS